MLPRRHILDVWEFIKDEEQLLSMSTVTLAIDAIKYMDMGSKRDHLVEALELNEFICYMYPSRRPKNRSLLFHVVSDLLGLLMYGVPRKKRPSIENVETVNYSERNMETYPVGEVWRDLKQKVYTKKHGAKSIIEGFVRKIRVEMGVIEQYGFVEDIFFESRERIKEWLPALSSYCQENSRTVKAAYDRWWSPWLCRESHERVLAGMIDRLCAQVDRDFAVQLNKDDIFTAIKGDKTGNRKENEAFSKWYREGVNLLLKI
jgi:hypothetical protein